MTRCQPVQWPLPRRRRAGARLFARGGFPTADGRARIVADAAIGRRRNRRADLPLILNTGRMRDQWHTMTRTGRVPRLMTHQREPLLDIHPADAAAAGSRRLAAWPGWKAAMARR